MSDSDASRLQTCEWWHNLRHELNNIPAPMLGQVQQVLLSEHDGQEFSLAGFAYSQATA